MAYVAINVLTVAGADGGAVLESRFADRAGMVEQAPGFLSFDLLRPVEGTGDYLVMTRWRERADYEAWLSSRQFQQGHVGGSATPAATGATSGAGAPSRPGSPGGPDGSGQERPGGGPAAVGSQIWGFEVVQSVLGAAAEGSGS